MSTRSRDRLKLIVDEYRKRLGQELGSELESLVLYGSQARGDAEAASDIDLLCIMKRPFNYASLIDRTSEITAELSLKHDVVISRVFVTSDDYRTRQTPFLMNVRREGLRV